VNRLRSSEYLPAPAEADARLLRGLPGSWQAAVAESSIDALSKRARGLAAQLTGRGRRGEAAELLRRVSLLERMDELHRHASNLQTLAGLYVALATFSGENSGEPEQGTHRTLAQTGLLADDQTTSGPAFRETAALRNRAFRLVASCVARYARGLDPPRVSCYRPRAEDMARNCDGISMRACPTARSRKNTRSGSRP